MINRDPFDIRSKPYSPVKKQSNSIVGTGKAAGPGLGFSGAGLTPVVRQTSSPVDAVAGNMSSYSLPQNGGPTHRHGDARRYDDRESLGERVSGMFGVERRQSLPMYKDKPKAYAKSNRRLPWLRQKRNVWMLLGSLALLSWWFGILSPLSYLVKSKGNVQDSDKSKTGDRGWFGGSNLRPTTWGDQADQVREAFQISWKGYEKHAWGFDEFNPVSKNRRMMTPKGLGWIIVDALDTMMIMNLTDELAHARQWLRSSLTYDQPQDVNTFETTIRMLGGLLSAHYLSSEFPGKYAPVNDGISDDIYVEKATDLADRLMAAFDSKSGVPYASVILDKRAGVPSHADGGASSTAEATSVQLELKYLSKLTGETLFWQKAERVMKVVDDNNAKDGLVPIFIYAESGKFRGDNIRLGSRGDSYYEYLIKQYLQTDRQEALYQAMWNESLAGVKRHLLTYSYPNNYTVLAERPNGLDKGLSPKMDHLVCFMPGTIALATTGGQTLSEARTQPGWSDAQEEDISLAIELMKTCWGMYKVTPTGLAPEIAHFSVYDPPIMYNDFTTKAKPSGRAFNPRQGLHSGNDNVEVVGKDDFIIKMADAHNLQRPETAESLFYMWRITGDSVYREWGWEMFQAFVKHTAVEDGTGFSSINDVIHLPPPTRDNMESFWLAETLKYLYLLFSPNDILPLTDVVFNTEAHPFPRFQMGKLFKTGWERKPRDSEGNIVPEPKRSLETEEASVEVITVARSLSTTAAETSTSTEQTASSYANDRGEVNAHRQEP